MKNILITLSIGLSIVVLFNILKPTPDSSKTKSEWFWAMKTHGDSLHDILLVGDSRTLRGLSPEVMNKTMLRKSILNIGYSSLGFSKEVFDFVDTKLKTKGDNRIIVLGITPHSLSSRAVSNDHLVQELSRKKLEVLLRMKMSPFFGLFEPISIFEYAKRISNEGDRYYETFHASGWVESDRYPENDRRALLSYRANLESNKIHTDILKRLFEQVQLWSDRGIKIFGFRPPTTIEMELIENELLHFDEQHFISSFESSGGVWFEFEVEDFETYDGSHLNSSSSKRLSKKLAAILNNAIGEDY